jgi:hypothetical protein
LSGFCPKKTKVEADIMDIAVDYEQDFYSWLVFNARLLREKRFSEADIENIAEELEGMSRTEKRALDNRLAVLLGHLLKWQFQPDKRSTSWKGTIDEQRKRIRKLLEESPSLKNGLEDRLMRSYDIGISVAVKDTGMKESVFPETCGYSLRQVLDKNFYPES